MPPEDLPTEILDHICELCETDDVRNLRLASKTLCSVANAHLLRELAICYNVHSITTATEIAKDRPDLAKGIRTLCFDAARLAGPMSYEAWPESWTRQLERLDFRRRAVHPSGSSLIVRDRVTDALDAVPNKKIMYEAYQSLFREQELLDMKGRGSLLRANLTVLLQGVPRLVSIHFDMHVTCDPELCRALRHRDRAFKLATVRPRRDPLPVYGGVHALTQVVRAAHDARRTIHELVVSDVSHWFFLQTMPVIADIYTMAANLKVFRWEFAWFEPYEIEREAMHKLQAGAVRNFFRHATSLKVLDLKLQPGLITNQVNIYDLIGDTALPHLKQLLLATATVTASTLGGILLQYHETLQQLSLHSIHFSGQESWNECFKSFAGTLKKLKEVHLGDEFTRGPGCHKWDDLEHTYEACLSPYDRDALSRYIIYGEPEPPRIRSK